MGLCHLPSHPLPPSSHLLCSSTNQSAITPQQFFRQPSETPVNQWVHLHIIVLLPYLLLNGPPCKRSPPLFNLLIFYNIEVNFSYLQKKSVINFKNLFRW
ncbi:hypothetical protein RND81_05G173400 [Saponaria officinalis]|uniref:Uncharacterized protein n=1 Tax=Saponaria officinalis TaxID=3572 RepID=A0AAW1KT77_SAPOF